MNNEKIYIIAIDGPAGSGKGTVAKEISKKLHYHYLDSGAIYRIIALACLKQDINFKDNQELIKLLQKTYISFKQGDSFSTSKMFQMKLEMSKLERLLLKLRKTLI